MPNAECIIINIIISTNIINIINIIIIIIMIIIIMIIMRLWLWPEIDFGMNHRAEMHQSGWLPIRKKYKTFSSFVAGKMLECGLWSAKSYSNFLFCPEAKEEDYTFRLCTVYFRTFCSISVGAQEVALPVPCCTRQVDWLISVKSFAPMTVLQYSAQADKLQRANQASFAFEGSYDNLQIAGRTRFIHWDQLAFGRFTIQFFILLSEDFRVVTPWFGVQCGLQIPARLDIFQLCYMCHLVSRMIWASLAKALLEHAGTWHNVSLGISWVHLPRRAKIAQALAGGSAL